MIVGGGDPLAEVVKPAEKVWAADSAAFYQGAIPYPWLYSSAIRARHLDGFVITFADGHAKWLSRRSKYGTTRDIAVDRCVSSGALWRPELDPADYGCP